MFVVESEDRIWTKGKWRMLTNAERYAVAMRLKNAERTRKHDLPPNIEIAKGMKVLVTGNIQTDLDLTNGARGTIIDIVLDPREPPLDDEEVVHLHYLPVYILVKMDKTRASQLEGLEPNIVPLQPLDLTMHIRLQSQQAGGKNVQRTVHRRQLAITGAYALTDYRAQGQTIPFVLVDIASPPTGKLTLFNLYVALSRSHGRNNIRLLRDFDDKVFLQSHNPDLLLEDERLGALDRRCLEAWRLSGGEARMQKEVGR